MQLSFEEAKYIVWLVVKHTNTTLVAVESEKLFNKVAVLRVYAGMLIGNILTLLCAKNRNILVKSMVR